MHKLPPSPQSSLQAMHTVLFEAAVFSATLPTVLAAADMILSRILLHLFIRLKPLAFLTPGSFIILGNRSLVLPELVAGYMKESSQFQHRLPCAAANEPSKSSFICKGRAAALTTHFCTKFVHVAAYMPTA